MTHPVITGRTCSLISHHGDTPAQSSVISHHGDTTAHSSVNRCAYSSVIMGCHT